MLGYLKAWLNTAEVFTDLKFKDDLKITILVAARNEAKNIEKCLESLSNQNYNQDFYEILLIDDFSEDETVLLASKYKKVHILKLSDFLAASFKNLPNKKRAISLGVETAKNEIIITADADCFYKQNWLKAMAQSYTKTQAKLITAPVLFYSKKNIFSSFLELDIISMMGITAADIKQGKPSMVNGANLLYAKNTFLELNAFEGNENVASGDDVFLMQKINEKYPGEIIFLKNKDAVAFTDSPNSFSEFTNQRIRWTSKSSRYADKKVVKTLVLNYLFYFFIFVGFVLSVFQTKILILVISVFIAKMMLDSVFFKQLLSFFQKEDLLKKIFWVEFLHLFYINILGILSLVGKYSWKGRKV